MKIELRIHCYKQNIFDIFSEYIKRDNDIILIYSRGARPFENFNVSLIKNLLSNDQFEQILEIQESRYIIFDIPEEELFYKILKYPEINSILPLITV